jgi:hypothetical protein
MKMRIAIIAACAGTLALAQTNPAQAAYPADSGSMSGATTTQAGAQPAMRLAAVINSTHSNIRHPNKNKTVRPGTKKQPISDQASGGSKNAGTAKQPISDQASGGSKNAGTAKLPISDQANGGSMKNKK